MNFVQEISVIKSNINNEDDSKKLFNIGIPFSEYIKFFDQNKEKIFMKPEDTFPINIENLELWKEKVSSSEKKTCEELVKEYEGKKEEQEEKTKRLYSFWKKNLFCDNENYTETYKLFAEIFSKVLRHISFEEMKTKIEAICKEIIELNSTKNYKKIFMFIDGQSQKSNTWISLIFTNFLLKHDSFVNKCHVIGNEQMNQLNTNFDSYYSKLNEDEKILIIHIDDMSYSGKQIYKQLTDTEFNWNRILSSKIDNTNFEYDKLDYYLGVAYIGRSGLEFVNNFNVVRNIKKFENTEVIESFVNQAKDYIENNNNYSEEEKKKNLSNITNLCGNPRQRQRYHLGSRSFQCASALIPVYFDHKVADSYSTFQKLIYYGSFPTTGECEFLPLLEGDHIKESLPNEKKLKDGNHCTEEVEYMEEHYPPEYKGEKGKNKTFYKNIKYTTTGKVPPDENIIDFLTSQTAGSLKNIKKYNLKQKKNKSKKNKSKKNRSRKSNRKNKSKKNRSRKSNRKNNKI